MNDAMPLIDVVAGVITDPKGRILLARRTEGRDLAGLWEFPGGKREPGESAEDALARELHEELGIRIEPGEAIISVPHAYPHKRLRLDVRRVRSWRGIPRGHEGQALAWVPVHKLPDYAMPPADRPVVAALLHPDHYLVTPPPTGRGKRWLSALERALGAGVKRVQLRAPGFDPGLWPGLAARAVEACRRAGVQVLVNGDVGLAQALGTGVHLRGSQLAEFDARPLPDGVPVAGSCHDQEEIEAAARIGCDFVVLGPVSETSSHPGTPGIGWDAFAAMRERCDLPIYAIGGLALRDIATARAHGAQGIAAIRGLWPGTL